MEVRAHNIMFLKIFQNINKFHVLDTQITKALLTLYLMALIGPSCINPIYTLQPFYNNFKNKKSSSKYKHVFCV